MAASSAGKSQAPVPLHGLPPRYSRPRPAGGARLRIVSKRPSGSTATQLTSGATLTRCCSAVVAPSA